ncbi:MAG TPA: OmpH family outer membrane protein [Myxococcales bacterium]
MSLRKVLAALAVSILFSPLARAELKLGYVDLQRALGEVEEGRAAKARLQSMIESKEKEITKEQEGLRKEKEVLDKQASAMSEEARQQKNNDLQKKVMELAQKWEKARQDMGAKERTELQAIFAKLEPIIATIAQREGMTMVFEKSGAGLVFAPPHLDMTNELVRMYNDQYHAKGDAKAEAGKPGADKPVREAAKSDAPTRDQAPPPKK